MSIHATVIDSSAISNMMVREFSDILKSYSGIIEMDGDLRMRGSTKRTNVFYLNGVMVNSFRDNSLQAYIIPQAIQSVDIIPTHGLNFSLGGSGIISTKLLSGGSKHRFSINAKSDKTAQAGEAFLGTTAYQDHILTAIASGPLSFAEGGNYFIAYQNRDIGDHAKRFSKGFQFKGLVDSGPNAEQATRQESVDLIYPDGFTPGNSLTQNALNSNFNLNYNGLKFNLTGLFNHQEKYTNRAPDLNILNKRGAFVEKLQTFLSGKAEFELNEDINLLLGGHWQYEHNELKDDYFGGEWLKWHDSTAVANHLNGPAPYKSAYRMANPYLLHGIRFNRNGTPASTYFKNENSKWGLKLAGSYNAIKNVPLYFGMEYQTAAHKNYSVNPDFVSIKEMGNSVLDDNNNIVDKTIFIRNSGVEVNGYSLLGKEDGDIVGKPLSPFLFSTFVSGQYFMDDITFDFGLHVNQYNSDEKYIKFSSKIHIDPITGLLVQGNFKAAELETYIAPRFAVKLSLNDRFMGILSYGRYNNLSRAVPPNEFFSFRDRGYNSVNKGLVLYSKYSAGVAYGDGEVINQLSAKLFYNNGKGIVFDSATQKGLEAQIESTRLNGIKVNAGATILSDDSIVQSIVRRVNLHGQIDFRFFENAPYKILNNSGLAVQWRYSSGAPYTHVMNVGSGASSPYSKGMYYMFDQRGSFLLEPINSSLTPSISHANLSIDKSIFLGENLFIKFYLEVYNLFNTKNVLNVYHGTKSATDDGYLSNPENYRQALNDPRLGQNYIDLYNALNIENGSSYWSLLGKQLWGQPRQVLFGMQIGL